LEVFLVALPQTLHFDNLLSAAKGYMTPDVVRKASVMTGESETATRQAMYGGVASVFAGLANMAGTSDGASTVANLSREPDFGGVLNNVSSSFGGGNETSSLMRSGQGLIGKIFGDRGSSVADALARSSGVSSSSSGKIMSMVAPLAMGVLGKHAAARGLSSAALANSLMEQQHEFTAAAPAGLSRLFSSERAPTPVGVHVAPDTETTYDAPAARTTAREPVRAMERPSGGRQWLPLLLIALIALGLLALIRNLTGRGRQATREAVQTTQNAGQQAADTGQNALSRITLPGGRNVALAPGSANYSLARFLADQNQTAPQTFSFEHLNFDSGSAQLTADSQETVTNLSQILNAYPNARAHLTGSADSTGSPEANQKLSLDRANSIKQMLVGDGVGGERITTSGSGQQQPTASNDTEQGRAENRRVELTVTQK
jgi:OmpA-OmpF porin, OOP family